MQSAVNLGCVLNTVSRQVIIAYAYAVVEIFERIFKFHVKVWVPPGVLAHPRPQVRRSYSYPLVRLALSAVTIVVLGRFVAAKLGKHVTTNETRQPTFVLQLETLSAAGGLIHLGTGGGVVEHRWW